jgi:hypothetical protein
LLQKSSVSKFACCIAKCFLSYKIDHFLNIADAILVLEIFESKNYSKIVKIYIIQIHRYCIICILCIINIPRYCIIVWQSGTVAIVNPARRACSSPWNIYFAPEKILHDEGLAAEATAKAKRLANKTIEKKRHLENNLWIYQGTFAGKKNFRHKSLPVHYGHDS